MESRAKPAEDGHETGVAALPVELLLNILSRLPPRSLCRAAAVCRTWREVAESPALWCWARVWINPANFQERLGAARLQLVREIRLQPWGDVYRNETFNPVTEWNSNEVVRNLVRSISGLPNLKKITNFEMLSLRKVDEGSVAFIVNIHEKIQLNSFDPWDLNTVLVVVHGETNLTELDFRGLPKDIMDTLNPVTLAKAAGCVQELVVSSRLKKRQLKELLAVASGESKLQILELLNQNFVLTDQEVLAKAVNKMEFVSLSGKDLQSKMESLFKKIDRDSKLKFLSLTRVEFTHVETKTVAEAFRQLESVSLNSCQMSKEILTAILAHGNKGYKGYKGLLKFFGTNNAPSKLEDLTLNNSFAVPYLDVDVRTLTESRLLRNLKSLDIKTRFMDLEKLTGLFEALRESSKLEILGFSCRNLYQIDENVLADCLTRIKSVHFFRDCGVSPNQITKIFSTIIEGNSNLEQLTLPLMNFSEVPSNILAEGINKLKKIYFDGGLDEEKIKEILQSIDDETNLKEIKFGKFGMQIGPWKIPTEVLVNSFNKLETVKIEHLCYSQLREILLKAMQNTKLKSLSVRLCDKRRYSNKDEMDFLIKAEKAINNFELKLL